VHKYMYALTRKEVVFDFDEFSCNHFEIKIPE